MDPRTNHALLLLEKHVRASPDARHRKAIAELRRALTEGGQINPRALLTNTATVTGARRSAGEAGDVDDDDDDRADDDPIDELFSTEMIEASIRASTADHLVASPPADPLPAQVRIVEAAIAEARRAGLRLPARVPLAWRDGHRDVCAGAVHWEAGSRTATVYLSVNASPDALRNSIFHELQHVHDFASGRSYTRLALERRALAFAARCCGLW